MLSVGKTEILAFGHLVISPHMVRAFSQWMTEQPEPVWG
jgi:hypothetical protein